MSVKKGEKMSTKPKHTPGPYIQDETDDTIFILSAKGSGSYIGQVEKHCTDGPNRRAEANARLFAGAPELLDALKDAREELLSTNSGNCYFTDCTCEGNGEAKMLMDRIEAAIRKAEGGEE